MKRTISQKPHIRILLKVLQSLGVRHVVCSPGSRNAPLMISFAEDPHFQTHVVPDERSAGFIGLGLSLEHWEPVVLVCTSGSAAINYGPALSEAYFLQNPLIALTADRPEEALLQGESQTINQNGLFNNYIQGSYILSDTTELNPQEWANQLSDDLKKGPVHINYHLSEPLYDLECISSEDVPVLSASSRDSVLPSPSFPETQKNEKVLLLCGFHRRDQAEAIGKLWADLGEGPGVLLTENTSQYSVPSISTIDRTLEIAMGQPQCQPTLLITSGKLLISRKIKSWLRSIPNLQHWHFGSESPGYAPYSNQAQIFNCSLGELLSHWKRKTPPFEASFPLNWMGADHRGHFICQKYLESTTSFCDLKVFEFLNANLSPLVQLHVANSSAIRYLQLFNWSHQLKIHCNRGVAGIDGTNSTAWGHAVVNPRPTVLITGDISFFYDSNFAWNSLEPENFKVILIHNGGGGIFRFIPGPDKTKQLESHFEFQHQRNAQNWCPDFGFTYYFANDFESLSAQFKQWNQTKGRALLEISTPSEENAPILRQLFKTLNQSAEHETVDNH